MARRSKLNPDQLPLIVPDSSWVRPSELPDLRRVSEFALDTENKDDGLAQGRGPGWVYRAGHVAGVGVAWWEGQEVQQAYIPIRHPDTENFDESQVKQWLKDITRKPRVVMHNAPYDVGWLETDLGVPLPPFIDDTTAMAVMEDENRYSFELDTLCRERGLPAKDEQLLREAATAYGFADVKSNLWRLPGRYVGPYGGQDAASTLMLARDLRKVIEREDTQDAYQLEMDLIPMVHAMRKRGIRFDVDRAHDLYDTLIARRDRVFARLKDKLGVNVSIDEIRQNDWLVNVFHNEGVEFKSDEESKKASFGKEWMRQGYVGRYKDGKKGHWLPQWIAEAKQCHEAAEKFVKGFLIDFSHNGRIHASINQFKSEEGGTRTFRFSYQDPPLQQMPSRPEMFLEEWTLTGEIAKDIRSLFLPEKGEKWFAPDYSQQEYRLIVHYAHLMGCRKADEAVAKYLNDPNTDFHNLVVDLTGLTRRRAKDCNFAKAYGAGIPKFADMTGMSVDEAKDVMNQYDGEMPFVKELGGLCTKKAESSGFIRLIDGARSHFDDWESAWLPREENSRGWSEGWPMSPARIDEARRRVEGTSDRPWKAAPDSKHPWYGKRLRRAHAHKAMNRLIQGSAARQTKIAMRECWRNGIVPLIQMHDELGASIRNEKTGKLMSQIMRDAVKISVPMRVDEEYGSNWGDAKHSWKEAKFAR